MGEGARGSGCPSPGLAGPVPSQATGAPLGQPGVLSFRRRESAPSTSGEAFAQLAYDSGYQLAVLTLAKHPPQQAPASGTSRINTSVTGSPPDDTGRLPDRKRACSIPPQGPVGVDVIDRSPIRDGRCRLGGRWPGR